MLGGGVLDWHRSKISLYDWNSALFCSSWTSTIGLIWLCVILDIFWHCQVITPSFQVKFKIWYNFHSKKGFFSNFWYIFQMFGTIFFWYEFQFFYKKFGIKFFFGMNFFLWFFSYWMVKFSKIMVHFVKKNTIFFIIFGIAVNYHV